MKISELLNKIFLELGFTTEAKKIKLGEIEYLIAINCEGHRSFIYLDLEDKSESILKDFEKNQGRIFDFAAKEFSIFTKDLQKNTYLIILAEQLEKSPKRSEIINIEEDPYFFKKSLLTYTKNDVEKLMGSVDTSKIVESLTDLAAAESIFDKFSQFNTHTPSFERLIYNLFIKVPAIPISFKSKGFEGLKQKIDTDLSGKNLDDTAAKLILALDGIDNKAISLETFKTVMDSI